MKEYIYQTDGKERYVGNYDREKNMFTTERKYSKHYMRKYKAWGLDKGLLEKYKAKNVKIVIVDTENKKRYETYTNVFIEKGITNEYWEHLQQVFLPLEHFRVSDI